MASTKQGWGSARGINVGGIISPPTRYTKVSSSHPQAIESDSTSYVHSTHLPGTPADGRPIPISKQRVALDEIKRRGDGDVPAGDTIRAVAQINHHRPA